MSGNIGMKIGIGTEIKYRVLEFIGHIGYSLLSIGKAFEVLVCGDIVMFETAADKIIKELQEKDLADRIAASTAFVSKEYDRLMAEVAPVEKAVVLELKVDTKAAIAEVEKISEVVKAKVKKKSASKPQKK